MFLYKICTMNDVEHQIQIAISQYLDLRGLCYWAVPNGGMRNITVASKLKKEGVKAGIPDISLVYKGKYFGIEVKKPKTITPAGTLSYNQKIRISEIEHSGGVVGVVYGVPDLIVLLHKWGIK